MIELRLNHSTAALPLYAQIAEQLTWQINQGQLREGDYLPPSRELARQLGISRGSVVRAYENLCATGLCISMTGRGTLVSARRTSVKPAHYSAPGMPPHDGDFHPGGISLLPSHASTEHLPVSEFRAAFNRVLRYPGRLNQFEESAGNVTLRQLICEKILPARGISASPSDVLIVPGTQYASVLLAMTLMQSRSAFHFGNPGYLEFAKNFARFGFRLQPHDIDDEGIRTDGLAGSDQDVLYVMPEHHFPQCITLSDHRRQQILHLAQEKNLLILEDDYDSEFYFDRVPQPALRASEIAHQVVYMGTFSKVLFNSVRLGYLVADEHLIQQMASLHWSLSRGTSGLLQQWVSELLSSGTYEKHLKRMRTVYRHKRDSVISLVEKYLPQARYQVPSGGLQLYLGFADARLVAHIVRWLRDKNIPVASSQSYTFTAAGAADYIILGFARSAVSEIEGVLKDLSRYLMCDSNNT